jgi:hypothetical protein
MKDIDEIFPIIIIETNFNNENGYSLTRIKHLAYKINCNERVIQNIIE